MISAPELLSRWIAARGWKAAEDVAVTSHTPIHYIVTATHEQHGVQRFWVRQDYTVHAAAPAKIDVCSQDSWARCTDQPGRIFILSSDRRAVLMILRSSHARWKLDKRRKMLVASAADVAVEQLPEEFHLAEPLLNSEQLKPARRKAVAAPAPTAGPFCQPACAITDWTDEPPVDKTIRTHCQRCGRFIGYRPKEDSP